MIEFRGVTLTYPDAPAPVLRDLHLSVPEGELCLVVGGTGTGKSTLLRAVNGLVPHFTGGTLAGTVTVAGRSTRDHPPRELADAVGYVAQDPSATFLADTVEDELAYTMESLGLAPAVMRRRVEDVLDLLGLAELRNRPVATLSGGQAQRVAIGAVLTASPRVLVLDEPTSALDPAAAEDVLGAVQRLVHDLALTVLMAEHRLERVVQHADTVLWLPGDGTAIHGAPAEVLARCPVVPPVVDLGRRLGWKPLPLTVRQARTSAAGLRERLPAAPVLPERPGAGPPVAVARRVVVSYGNRPALRGVDLTVRTGEVVALMGRNGSGKSTLLRVLTGLLRPGAGTVRIAGTDPAGLRGRSLPRLVGLVPQRPADLLYADTVGDECRLADREAGAAPGAAAALLEGIAGPLDAAAHPSDLSEGQRLELALAVVLASAPPLLLLDEPTRGLDYPAKARLATALTELARGGTGLVLATHDVELAAEISDRTVVLADGEVVADGPSREVVTSSPVFAPQVAKVLAPLPYLTVSDVTRTLAGAGATR